jgi:hypothetical protein
MTPPSPITLTKNKRLRQTIQFACGRRTLTVQGEPNVSVTITPADLNGASGGTTPLTRSYNSGTQVAMTAPSSALDAPFHHWERNGVNAGAALSIAVTMDADHTLKAVYATTKRIQGRVTTSGGAGVGDVRVGTGTTNADGDYTATVSYGFTGTLTPSKSGCTLRPRAAPTAM